MFRLTRLGFAVVVWVAGCHDQPSPTSVAARMRAADYDLVETLAQPDVPLGTLLRAVQSAGLIDDLSGAGTFTLFAPTDKAFAALSVEVQERLLDPDHRDQLRAVLLAHVHPGVALSADLRPTRLSTATGGRSLDVTTANGTIAVNGAQIVRADILCKNGVIHCIDKVLMP